MGSRVLTAAQRALPSGLGRVTLTDEEVFAMSALAAKQQRESVARMTATSPAAKTMYATYQTTKLARSIPSPGETLLGAAGIGAAAAVAYAGVKAVSAADRQIAERIGLAIENYPTAQNNIAERMGLLNGGKSMGYNGLATQVGYPAVDGVPIAGPGVPEPPASMVAKMWWIQVNAKDEAFRLYFWRLIDGRVMSYHPYKGWKIWRPKKPLAVMYRGKTTLSQAVKVQKYLDKLWRTVAKKTKALKMA